MNAKIAIFLSLVAAGLLHSSASSKDEIPEIEGYYWRNYRGITPPDALHAGYNFGNKTTYVGQVLSNSSLIPGEIIDADKRIFFEVGTTAYTATERLKILCSQDEKAVEWIETNKDDFKELMNKTLVPGGFEPGNKVFIGRLQMDNVIVVGKVLARLPDLRASFRYVLNDDVYLEYTFQVLAYT